MPGHHSDLAAQCVPLACELACLVRDEGREQVTRFLGRLSGEQTRALLVLLAAMVPVDQPVADLLAWAAFKPGGTPGTGRHEYHREPAGPAARQAARDDGDARAPHPGQRVPGPAVNRAHVEAMLWQHIPGASRPVIDGLLAVIDAYGEAQFGAPAGRRLTLLTARNPAPPLPEPSPLLGIPGHRDTIPRPLRQAHAAAASLRQAGFTVPEPLAALEREYWRLTKQAQRARRARRPADRVPPLVDLRWQVLRDAHSEASRLRRAGHLPSGLVAALDREYERIRRRRTRATARAEAS